MEEIYNYLAVIPARGGSKRIPNKNMTEIYSKPLIYWTIKYAIESKLLDKIIVSTNDKSIITYCKLHNINVDIRQESLAGDTISLTEVMKDITNRYVCDNIVILRPTSPIRVNNVIDRCIKSYKAMNVDSLMTGFMNKEREWFTHEDEASQLVKGWFQGDGCVEITSSNILKQGKTYGNHKVKILLEEIYNHEIDTYLDIVIIESIMKHIGMKE